MDLESLESVVCEECGYDKFYQVFSLKKMSALVSESGQQTYVPVIEGFECNRCGHINSEFIKEKPEEKKEPESKIIKPGS